MSRTAAAVSTCLALACATPPNEAWIEALRADAAPGGAAADLPVVLVWAEDRDEAWGRIVRARTEGPLEESALLARVFEGASVASVEVALGGPYPELNEQVAIDAFALAERDVVPGLRLLFVSPSPPGDRLLELCRRKSAACQHRPWRGAPPR